MRAKIHHDDGAAAVEFALVVGLLSILVFGLLEYGVAFWQVQNLRAATREGARVGAVGGDEADIEAAMVASSAGSLDGGFDIDITPGLCTDETSGGQIKVTIINESLSGPVQAAFDVSIPFLPPIQLDPELSGTFRCE
jgi:hypothetical protein